MPPRKPSSAQNNPKVVRRVVKKIITEEIIEEIIHDPKPASTNTKTQKKVNVPKKLTPKSGLKKPVTKRTPKTESTVTKKATAKKSTTARVSQKAKTPAEKSKSETKPNPPPSRVKKEATPSKSSTPAARKKPLAKKSAALEPKSRKTQQTAAKARQNAANSNSSKRLAVKPTITKTPSKARQNAANSNNSKRLPVKPTITKTRKPTSAPAKKSSVSKSTASVGIRRPENQAFGYAQMLNDAMLTARQAAQEEMNALMQKNNVSYVTPRFDDPLPIQPAVAPGNKVSADFSVARPSTLQNPAPPLPRAKRVKQTSRRSGGITVTPAELEKLGLAGNNPIPPVKRVKQTARKSTGIPASLVKTEPQPGGSTLPPMPRAKQIKRTARKTATPRRSSTSISASPSTRASKTSSDHYVWELTHETGYVPDGFHSFMEPTKRNLGTFATREAAMQRGQREVGSNVGYSWEEVQESGDFETVSDSVSLWEVCWSPPDSEYSRVTARRINTTVGRWIVDVDHGYPPSRFHSYHEPTKKQLGPYQSRARAVQIGKKQVGAVYGIDWDEVFEGGDLEVIEDSSKTWEVSWTPPDSEHTHVVARMLPATPTGEVADLFPGGRDRQSDSDDDNDGFYNVAL